MLLSVRIALAKSCYPLPPRSRRRTRADCHLQWGGCLFSTSSTVPSIPPTLLVDGCGMCTVAQSWENGSRQTSLYPASRESVLGRTHSVLSEHSTIVAGPLLFEGIGKNHLVAVGRALFFNPPITTEILRSTTIRTALMEAGFSKIGYLRKELSWLTSEELAAKAGFKSVCLAQHMLDDLN